MSHPYPKQTTKNGQKISNKKNNTMLHKYIFLKLFSGLALTTGLALLFSHNAQAAGQSNQLENQVSPAPYQGETTRHIAESPEESSTPQKPESFAKKTAESIEIITKNDTQTLKSFFKKERGLPSRAKGQRSPLKKHKRKSFFPLSLPPHKKHKRSSLPI